jgi:hypothetical protein
MIFKTVATIHGALQRYNHFDECILLDVNVHQYQTVLELQLNYIWKSHNVLRDDIDDPEVVLVRFTGVQEVHIYNDLSSAMLEQPEGLNWGMNEVSLVRLENDVDLLEKYEHLDQTFHHVAVLWENDRRIDVVFRELEIVAER